MEKQKTTEEERKKFIRQMRKENEKQFPIVMKSKNGNLEIIYRNRVELYTLTKKESYNKEDENLTDDAYAEIELAKGSGFKRVCDTTEADDWRFDDE